MESQIFIKMPKSREYSMYLNFIQLSASHVFGPTVKNSTKPIMLKLNIKKYMTRNFIEENLFIISDYCFEIPAHLIILSILLPCLKLQTNFSEKSLITQKIYAFSIVQIPIAIKPNPAAHARYLGLIYFDKIEPAITPIADVSIRASEAPINTDNLLLCAPEA